MLLLGDDGSDIQRALFLLGQSDEADRLPGR